MHDERRWLVKAVWFVGFRRRVILTVIGGEPSVPSGGFQDTIPGKPDQRSEIANGREFVVLRQPRSCVVEWMFGGCNRG